MSKHAVAVAALYFGNLFSLDPVECQKRNEIHMGCVQEQEKWKQAKPQVEFLS